MAITDSDILDAYVNALEDPFLATIMEVEEQARRDYVGRVYYLDDCGESKYICNRCGNRFECGKRMR